MTISVRKTPDAINFAVASQFNNLMKDVALAGSKAHAAVTSNPTTGDYRAPTSTPLQVTAGNGDGTLATLRTLVQDIFDVYMGTLGSSGNGSTRSVAGHMSDVLAHKVAETPPAITRPLGTDNLATVQTALNALKADYNTHRVSTTYHYTADSTNTLATADGSDQASCDTLANAFKIALNAHVKFGPVNALALNLIDP